MIIILTLLFNVVSNMILNDAVSCERY